MTAGEGADGLSFHLALDFEPPQPYAKASSVGVSLARLRSWLRRRPLPLRPDLTAHVKTFRKHQLLR